MLLCDESQFSKVSDRFSKNLSHRGEQLVDKAGGFDYYLLKTPVNEIYAEDLLMIKREILLALCRKDELKEGLWEKYKEFALPFEEADWHGLPIELAREKQEAAERLSRDRAESTPLKAELRAELIQQLKEGAYDDIDPEVLNEEKSETLGKMLSKAKKWINK